MALLEVIISYTKILFVLALLGYAVFELLFRIMCGGMDFYYLRTSDFNNQALAIQHTHNVGSKFKPLFNNIDAVPIAGTLNIEANTLGNKTFKK